MSLQYEPSSEQLHISASWLFLNWELQVVWVSATSVLCVESARLRRVWAQVYESLRLKDLRELEE